MMQRFTLPKSCLLRKNGEYNLVYQNGSRFKGKGFALVVLPQDRNGSRLGISVKRTLGTAVDRNRMKRIIRETFRLHRHIFPSSSDIVFVVRPQCPLHTVQAVQEAVMQVMEKAKNSHVSP